MSKKFYILTILITIAIAAIIVFLFIYFNSATQTNVVTEIPRKTGENNELLPIEELKKEEKINVSNGNAAVNVENPYRIASNIITPKDVVVESNDNFDILFYNYNGKKSFLIDLHDGNNYSVVRSDAEKRFLELLKIDKEQACLLDVSEGVSENLDSKLAGKNLSLSFCIDKK
jgi:hypothetical protein